MQSSTHPIYMHIRYTYIICIGTPSKQLPGFLSLLGYLLRPKLFAIELLASLRCLTPQLTFAVSALAIPFIIGARAANPPLPLICNGFSNLGFSAVRAMWGNPAIATACVGWGIASLLIAQKQTKQLKDSAKATA